MLGASHAETASKKADVCKVLEEKLNHELVEVHKEIRKACVAFEICLSEGAEKSQKWCEGAVRSFLYRRDGRGFHKTLKSVVENNGVYKPPKKKELNLNVKLASHMTDSIDEQFKKTFPNEGKHGPFNGIISKFSLDTKRLADDYKDVELQLIFLNTEEEKLKAKVNTLIRKQKKKIYACLPEAIEESMQECYAKAAGFRGQDTLRNMRETIENHVRDSKLTMFVNTMDVMMMMLKKLKETILNTMTTEMQKSMEASLKMDDTSIPDVTSDYEIVKKCFEELKESFQHETTTLVI
ncbi:hypothetical protein LDENG_00073870 [Lucifuga dentata]|nr:hypothetical protein LDENG_00073870 [Lucifuga dentata]